jgi:hypothetical protein
MKNPLPSGSTVPAFVAAVVLATAWGAAVRTQYDLRAPGRSVAGLLSASLTLPRVRRPGRGGHRHRVVPVSD